MPHFKAPPTLLESSRLAFSKLLFGKENPELTEYLEMLPSKLLAQITTCCQGYYVEKLKNYMKENKGLDPSLPILHGLMDNDQPYGTAYIVPSLESLYLPLITKTVTRLDFSNLIHLGTLGPRVFDYFNKILDRILVQVPNLQSLIVKSPNSRTSLPSFATNHLRILGQHCPLLKFLDISFHNGLKNEDLGHLIPYEDRDGCPDLEILYVFDCSFSDKMIKQLVVNLKNLKELGYKEMGKVCKRLYKDGFEEVLNFTHINNMGAKIRKTSVPSLRCKPNMIQAINVLCPNVTNIRLRVQDSDVEHLSSFKHLRSVELLFNCGKALTPALGTCQFIQDRGSNLTSIAITCATISMTHINVIAKNCPNLVSLWLRSNFFQISKGCQKTLPEDMPANHGYLKRLEVLYFRVGEGELSLSFVPEYVFHYILKNAKGLKELIIALRSNTITDQYICGLLKQNKLNQLQKIMIVVPGLNNLPRVLNLGMESVNFMLDFCQNLRILGNLMSWKILGTENDQLFTDFKNELELRNVDINIICRIMTMH